MIYAYLMERSKPTRNDLVVPTLIYLYLNVQRSKNYRSRRF